MCREWGCRLHPSTTGCEGHRHPRRRRFLTKAEKVERLTNYAEELRKELAAVEEAINEMKS